MQSVYFISGLGADERVFQYLRPERCLPHYVRWITPLDNETMEHYAGRLLEQITDSDPVLIGLSFGGMMAIEISKLMPVRQIILLSSAKCGKELPPYFGLLRYVRIHQWLPFSWLQGLGILSGNWLFGTENKAASLLLKSVIRQTEKKFFRWAWEKIIHWNNEKVPSGLIHIHGDRDRMLPVRYARPTIIVRKGSHLMVVNKASQIAVILQELIDNISDGQENSLVNR